MKLEEGIEHILLTEEYPEYDLFRITGHNDQYVMVRAKKISNNEMLYDLYLPFDERFPIETISTTDADIIMKSLLERYETAKLLNITQSKPFYHEILKYVVPGNHLLSKQLPVSE